MLMQRNLRRALTAALACFLTTISSACVPSTSAAPPRTLPPSSAAGELFQPVPHPRIKAGDDARAKLAETSAALTTANGRIEGARRWYETVRSEASGAGK